eukprot:CAMPEP_0177658100 /NCGR_PEP_ID=MMETSP0447-20121125/16613_1 /TAXON_ID=0 /ORGANISM="Stygamoeba regulata, Strain BSH-02190019" /LENGTH=100 /DNA_ID=CAMNT_0019162649 /DNA_START=210 /DNA_END=510 /DNA_ORIENTATION=+
MPPPLHTSWLCFLPSFRDTDAANVLVELVLDSRPLAASWLSMLPRSSVAAKLRPPFPSRSLSLWCSRDLDRPAEGAAWMPLATAALVDALEWMGGRPDAL